MAKIRTTIRDAAVNFADRAGWLTIVDPLLVESYHRAQGRLPTLDEVERGPDTVRVFSAAKRGMDIVGAAIALILILPLFLVLSLLIKLTSKGPIFSPSERIGYGGRTFKMYRFRAMFVAPTRQSDGVFVYRIASDPRTTRIGRFLRRTSLDELPQFWNVLKGDMSLVGPRPLTKYEAEYETDLDDKLKRMRLSVAPGITGLSPLIPCTSDQRMKYQETHPYEQYRAMELNLLRRYISNRSVRLDLMALARATHDWFRFLLRTFLNPAR